MPVAETSKVAYREVTGEGVVTNQQKQILRILEWGRDYSLQEIVSLTGIGINMVSGRVSELKDMGILVSGNKRKCSITGRTIIPSKLAERQLNLISCGGGVNG